MAFILRTTAAFVRSGAGWRQLSKSVSNFSLLGKAKLQLHRSSSLLLVRHASVTGIVYEGEGPQVTLFTKEGCTLCDKVKDVLQELRGEIPHSLEQVDITDKEHSQWFAKYKYDIPVLHVNGKYWLKHRTDLEATRSGLLEAQSGNFGERKGEPNAAAMEHRE